MKKLLPLLFGLIAINAFAVEATDETTINMVQAYPEYGGGDVVFRVVNSSENCHGYWITPSMAGFDSTYSSVLSAFHSGAKVKIYGKSDSSSLWSGSSYHYCKVYGVSLVK